MAFCPSCGAQHPEDADYCPSCGTPLTAAAARSAKGYGGFWRRFAAFVIDGLIINIPLGLVARATGRYSPRRSRRSFSSSGSSWPASPIASGALHDMIADTLVEKT